MNRFKKELRKRNIKLECDYPTLPHYIKDNSPFDVGNICIEGIVVNSEACTVTEYTNVIIEKYRVNRDFSFTDVCDDGNPPF